MTVTERNLPKSVRVEQFIRRLEAAGLAGDTSSAFKLVCETLNAVEDELTNIPYNLDTSDSDGRLYPPLEDNVRAVEGHSHVKRYRHRSHNTFIGDNGAIEIQLVAGKAPPLISKHGSDGRGVWEQ